MSVKDIKGYEGLYTIDEEENVFSCYTNRYLKHTDNGYLAITLSKKGKVKTITIHRLLANHFIDNPKGYTEIDHIDMNKKNNKLSNLRWCSRSENCRNTVFVKNSNSKYTGVYWHKRDKKFLAALEVQKENKNLGRFDNEMLAALAYDKYVIENNLDRETNIINQV